MNNRTELAIKLAKEAIAIMEERASNYENENITKNALSKIMMVLYPNGVDHTNMDEVERYKYISQIVDKLCRYRLNYKLDNLLDGANYFFLLAAFDEESRGAI